MSSPGLRTFDWSSQQGSSIILISDQHYKNFVGDTQDIIPKVVQPTVAFVGI
jgi:hypothetical protein